MRTFQWNVMFVFCMAFLLVPGCDSEDNDLFDDYKSHVAAAKSLVRNQMNGAGTSDEAYHSQMEGHLSGMEAVGEHMSDRCAELTDCRTGGGATGDVRNGHMHGGHMLTAEEMSEMHQGQRQLGDEMDRFERTCLEVHSNADVDAGLVDCDAYRPEHFDHMNEWLDDHYKFCEEMMEDGHMNGGGMMGGGRM